MKKTQHYTNSDRHKIYSANKIKLQNTPIIKTGASAIKERKNLIAKSMKYNKKPIFCKALNQDVFIQKKSIKETKEHASLCVKSTLYAINVADIIENAIYIKSLVPNSRNQSSYKQMHLLICPIKTYGYAKLIIGELFNPYKDGAKYIQYCVTHISLREIKK